MNYALLAALVGVSLFTTGCGCMDTVFYGKQSCAPHWTGSCGGTADCCGGGYDDCGGGCCDDGLCHQCPLIEVLSALHPNNLLCVHEYRERDACGCGYGCGEKYYGDWYGGERAGCEPCDCHGHHVGGGRSYGYHGGGEIHEGEMIEGEAAPARGTRVKPGPRTEEMPTPAAQSRGKRTVKGVPAKMAKSQKSVKLRPVDEAEWTRRR